MSRSTVVVVVDDILLFVRIFLVCTEREREREREIDDDVFSSRQNVLVDMICSCATRSDRFLGRCFSIQGNVSSCVFDFVVILFEIKNWKRGV